MDKQDQVASVNTITSRKFRKLVVRLSKNSDYSKTFDLHFDLVPSPFLHKWIDRFLHAQHRQDPISEPWAMYNLNDAWDDRYTVDFINMHIATCNDIVPGMFTRTVTDLHDQDTLNYIHSVFELHHGQLDTWQDNPIFQLPKGNELRNSLSHINQTVHRLESRSAKMRVVYFDLPKTKVFAAEDYAQFTNTVDWGGVYTLYADVGKNLESLAEDNDDHHHDFVPNLHYSADFAVRFYDRKGDDLAVQYKQYLKENLPYFESLGYAEDDIRLTTGHIKLAQLRYTDKQLTMQSISNYDTIQSAFLVG